MTDVVLIYPKTGFDLGAGIAPPFSVLSVAAEISGRFDIRLIDQRVEDNWESELREQLKKSPVCVGISSMTSRQLTTSACWCCNHKRLHTGLPLLPLTLLSSMVH